MFLRFFTIVILFFLFSLIQVSFLPYFGVTAASINLIFILFFILIFFDKNREGFFVALIAGFFVDVFLPSYFGISMVVLLIIYLIKEMIVHFLKESREKFSIIYFVVMFSSLLAAYYFLMYFALLVFGFSFGLNQNIMVGLVMNILFACLGFYIYKNVVRQDSLENQLKLF